LIEIMIAIAIFSLVMVAVYSSWNMIVKGKDMGLKAAADAQKSRMTMHAIESALFGVRMFEQNKHHHQFLVDTIDPFAASISFVSYLPRSFPGSGLLGYQPLRRVSFLVEDGENGEKDLVLEQLPMLQSLESDEEPIRIVLARNIAAFTLQFWDSRRQEWLEEWTEPDRLPQQVNVALALKSEEGDQIVTADVRTVTIPSLTILSEYQMPGGQPQPGDIDPGLLPSEAIEGAEGGVFPGAAPPSSGEIFYETE
jgi:hypothetical protein